MKRNKDGRGCLGLKRTGNDNLKSLANFFTNDYVAPLNFVMREIHIFRLEQCLSVSISQYRDRVDNATHWINGS